MFGHLYLYMFHTSVTCLILDYKVVHLKITILLLSPVYYKCSIAFQIFPL
nr:MAG TPA: hypothetical protein [Bacteriophage sp.]